MLELSEKQQFCKSWNSTIPEFENLLTKIRNGKLKDALELINVSSGKYVYHGKAEGFDFAYKTQQGKKFLRYIFRPSLPYREAQNYAVLEKLGIPKTARLKNLSKGNKEKVCLILVMSRNALLYVLDEPIAAVDPATRDYVISTIINNYNPDASVLISTHIISDIEPILDEAIFINKGKIVLHKTVDDIREENQMSVDGLFREVFKW